MREAFRRMARKARGIVGLGLLGAIAGFVLGGVWGVVTALLRSGVVLDPAYLGFLGRMALGNAVGFAMIGAFTTSGFGALVASVDSKRSLEELPLWRMALFGALVAALFPPIFVVGRQGLAGYLEIAASLLPVSGVLGVIGGTAAASLVAVAKRTGRAELRGDDEGAGRLRGEVT